MNFLAMMALGVVFIIGNLSYWAGRSHEMNSEPEAKVVECEYEDIRNHENVSESCEGEDDE